ncbi:MAG: hypothetical protein ACREBW_09695 [Candidatus Micrarchaeaceae archaeon]
MTKHPPDKWDTRLAKVGYSTVAWQPKVGYSTVAWQPKVGYSTGKSGILDWQKWDTRLSLGNWNRLLRLAFRRPS